MLASTLVLLLTAELLQPVQSFCPRACDCLPNNDATDEQQQTLTLDCSGRDLLEIPYPLPNGTTHL